MSVLLVVEPDPELDPDVGERLARLLRAEVAAESVTLVRGWYAPTGHPSTTNKHGQNFGTSA